MKEFFLSLIVPKDRKTLEKWLLWLELEGIAGGILFAFVLLLMAFQEDLVTVLKLGVLAGILFLGASTVALFQVLLQIEWNTRKKG